jgi:hypothetical protein
MELAKNMVKEDPWFINLFSHLQPFPWDDVRQGACDDDAKAEGIRRV